MNDEKLGGMVLRHISPHSTSQAISGADAPYIYRWERWTGGHTLEGFSEYCVYVLDCAPTTRLKVEGRALNRGDSVSSRGPQLKFSCEGEAATVLIAGTKGPGDLLSPWSIQRSHEHYTVTKPWGSERWINGDGGAFALKVIQLRAGHRTSLQFHEQKRETNFLLSGRALLHHCPTPPTQLREVELEQVQTREFGSQTAIDVPPLTLHRIEAVEDLLLAETSTPHLDDVVRVHDDSQRGDGRIGEEHAA